MTKSWETPHHFEVISPEHDVTSFACEDIFLTTFLKTHALYDTKTNLSRTFVCLDETSNPETVVGYFTLRAETFQIGQDRESVSLPVVEIAALARHEERHGEDWGSVLISEALVKVLQAACLIGLSGVQLKPTYQGRPLYENIGFMQHPTYPNWMYIPLFRIPDIQ